MEKEEGKRSKLLRWAKENPSGTREEVYILTAVLSSAAAVPLTQSFTLCIVAEVLMGGLVGLALIPFLFREDSNPHFVQK